MSYEEEDTLRKEGSVGPVRMRRRIRVSYEEEDTLRASVGHVRGLFWGHRSKSNIAQTLASCVRACVRACVRVCACACVRE